MKKVIAVSGDAGSFSEEAGLLFAMRSGIDEPDLRFAIDMEGVLVMVEDKSADFGIFPVVNSRGGLVKSAFAAMSRHLFHMDDEIWMEVHQCLLALPGVKREDIKAVATHPQAIVQCERYLQREFKGIQLREWEDTAKAAKDLHEGLLPRDTAVIAPARTAKIYDLVLIEKGIQDNHPNMTTFIVVTRHQDS